MFMTILILNVEYLTKPQLGNQLALYFSSISIHLKASKALTNSAWTLKGCLL